jgi:hypothetical protein
MTRRSQPATPKLENQHLHCEVEFRQRGPHWGMYCSEHNRWIRWMRQEELVALGVIPAPPPQYLTRYEADQFFQIPRTVPVRDTW